jgi:hypothetical protein
MSDFTIRDMLRNEPFREEMEELSKDVKLGDIWQAFVAGRSVTSEDARQVMTDLLVASEYFNVAPPDATGDVLQRREGKRELMARILFLSDLPSSAITRARRDVLNELQTMQR